MRSARARILFLSLFLFLISPAVFVLGTEGGPGAGQTLSEFEGIKMRLASIEKTQQDILAEKNKIIEELGILRVRIRHSGSNKKK